MTDVKELSSLLESAVDLGLTVPDALSLAIRVADHSYYKASAEVDRLEEELSVPRAELKRLSNLLGVLHAALDKESMFCTQPLTKRAGSEEGEE